MLHYETVEPGTLGLLKNLMQIPELNQFRLVGGTALALLLGHRTSIDLDLFTEDPFDKSSIFEALQKNFSDFSIVEPKSPRLLFAHINGIKTDFVHTFEPFYFDFKIIDAIRLATLEEIAAFKLNAVAGRGAKKDFWDIHRLLKIFTFDQMLGFYSKKYPHNDSMMVIKSINYFEDAEENPNPHSFEKTKWENIKKELKITLKNYLNTK